MKIQTMRCVDEVTQAPSYRAADAVASLAG